MSTVGVAAMTLLVKGDRTNLGKHPTTGHKDKSVRRVRRRVAAVNLFSSLVHMESVETAFDVAVSPHVTNDKKALNRFLLSGALPLSQVYLIHSILELHFCI